MGKAKRAYLELRRRAPLRYEEGGGTRTKALAGSGNTEFVSHFKSVGDTVDLLD